MAEAYPYKNVRSGRGTLRGGATAGAIAGACSAALAMLVSFTNGMGFWSFWQLCAGTFLGVDTLVAGPMSGVVGAVAFGLVSAAYGVIFASMMDADTSAPSALWSGLVFGLCVWVLRTYITLPLFNPVMGDRVALMSGWWFLENLVFGGLLAFTPALKARYAPARTIPSVRRDRALR
ncbi:MAG: hypothetical protein HY553_05185 [Elusimicrobia bacterium]|nr:hypothetical protein [Elusimicrobiota bacterium]